MSNEKSIDDIIQYIVEVAKNCGLKRFNLETCKPSHCAGCKVYEGYCHLPYYIYVVLEPMLKDECIPKEEIK